MKLQREANDAREAVAEAD